MKHRNFFTTMMATALAVGLALAASTVIADDGERLVRNVSSSPGTVEDPEPEGEHAFIKLMNFRVPAQLASGELSEGIIYNTIDGDPPSATVSSVYSEPVLTAKPLVNVYVYGPVIGFDNPEASGFAGHGRRDAFGAISLDDGESWKVTNLSNSGDKSSFIVSTPLQDPGEPAGGDLEFDVTSDTPIVTETEYEDKKNSGVLHAKGEDAGKKQWVYVRDAITHEVYKKKDKSSKEGEWEIEQKNIAEAPCYIQAGDGDELWGPAVLVDGAAEDCPVDGGGTLITDYPGDVPNVFHAVAGNRVMVAWHSKFCTGGNPVWAEEFDAEAVGDYLVIDNTVDLYLTDMFGAAGSQSSTDYNELGNEPVGEVPYSCLWSARGVLREDPGALGTTEVVWFQAERLTSGARDVNRVETACVAGAGCAITWQEDPEGVRPGEGEGPGTGWSGATTASKTDIWYSFVEWEDMDIVNDDDAPVPLADNVLDTEFGTNRPKPYVPMMAAVRLTNNDRCTYPVAVDDESYCNDAIAGAYGIIDQCVGSVTIQTGGGGQTNDTEICVVDSNESGSMDAGDMPNLANTAASRPRLNMQPRKNADGIVDDAWVVVVSEEDKGLGRYGFINTEEWALDNLDDTAAETCEDPPQQPDEETGCQKADVGKNVFWASFALGSPATSEGVDDDYSLVNNVVVQGAQLNQPEVNWRTGVYYPPMSTEQMWEFGDLDYLIFNTEIARRTSMMSQSAAKATNGGLQDGLVAMPLWKQGIVNQGGPADISTRRIVAPADVDELTENPYSADNIVCAFYDGEGAETAGVMYFTDDTNGGANPYYPNGLCMAAPINLAARTPYECEVSGESDGICPGAADMTCVDDADFGQLCLSTTNPEDNKTYDKLVTWYECPGWNGINVSGDAVMDAAACDSAVTGTPGDVLGSNMDDASWYNPLEVSKAHRGFLDGNHAFMIYAWSPNFKLNAVGTDRYELYTRRSFDGGVTWTTTPESFVASNGETYSGAGTTTCETMRDGASVLTTHVCTEYAAGDPEQSRNVSQHKSMKITTLDPRYTAAGGIPPKGVTDPGDIEWGIFEPIDPTDILDPSRNFVVFETGDNETVAEGEAEPLNLDYGRAELFGDHFTVWTEMDTGNTDSGIDECYPNNAHETDDALWAVGTGFCNEFDTIEGFRDALSEEASITASANGDFLYAVWGQFNVDLDNDHEFIDGDSMFRRVWYLDGYISEDNAYTLPGTN